MPSDFPRSAARFGSEVPIRRVAEIASAVRATSWVFSRGVRIAVIRAFCLALPLVAGMYVALGESPKTRDVASRVLAEVAMDEEADPIVSVVARGKRYRLLADTGAGRCGFDRRHCPALGNPTCKAIGQTPGGAIDIEMFHLPEIAIGPLRFELKDDISYLKLPFTDSHGNAIDGVLGMDVLKRSVLLLDFDHSKLQFLDSADPTFGQATPIFYEADDGWSRPFVRAIVNHRSEDFQIDTGRSRRSCSGLSGNLFDTLIKEGSLRSVSAASADHARMVNAGGKVSNLRIAAGACVWMGGYELQGLGFSREKRTSVLGADCLSRFNVLFDFPNAVMYLQRRVNLDRDGSTD